MSFPCQRCGHPNGGSETHSCSLFTATSQPSIGCGRCEAYRIDTNAARARIATLEAERDAALAWKQAAVTDATRLIEHDDPPLVFVLGGLHIPVERYTEMRTALATTLARIAPLEAALREAREMIARDFEGNGSDTLRRIDAALAQPVGGGS